MNYKTRRRPLMWLLLTLLTVVLVACNAATGGEPAAGNVVEEAAVTQDENSAEPEATDTAVADPTEPPATTAPVIEEAVPATEAPPAAEENIMTVDDRSDRLRSLTSSWGTNWERHTVDYAELLSGGPPRDGIPSIDAPKFVSQEEAAEWLAGNEPVIAIEIDGEARAYPLQVLTWHEIANDTLNGVPIVVTFCPLCNSALVFDRRFDGQTFEFGVSGLLRNSDLIMYDRTTETLWQQFTGEAIIGDLAGEQLEFLASSLVSFDDFRAAFPDSEVLSRETGFDRAYGRNPYAGYDTVGSRPFLFDGNIDNRLDAMARVVTVSLSDAGVDVAYPVDDLAQVGAINDAQGGQDIVVFHTSGTSSALGAAQIAAAADVGATGVFDPNLDGQKLTFSKEGENIVDAETSSTWNILGQAIDGPLAGQALEPIVHADHFWFSWAAFKPDTVIYQTG